jgi:hypothetical protein
MLSQISSTIWILSATLSCKISETCIRELNHKNADTGKKQQTNLGFHLVKIMRPHLYAACEFADGFDVHGFDHAAFFGDPFY